MKKTERIQNIKLDIHTMHFDPSAELLRGIRTEFKQLMRIYGTIVGADVSLMLIHQSDTITKFARFRIGIPGQSLIAEAVSTTWRQALAEVREKLQEQILSRPQAI